MRAHFRYLWYVLRHKWYVFRACLVLRVPLHQAIIHDWQKFTPTEWRPYVETFYAPDGSGRYQPSLAFDRAWLHHQHYGPHHWQYWILREDSGGIKALEMPKRFAREMVADWIGAGLALGKPDTEQWYLANKEKIVLHDSTRYLVTQLIKRAQRNGIIPRLAVSNNGPRS
jgi:uncharacterized protein DUF5662